ncbi:MAG: phosphatidylserine decarboxylase [Rickettsiales bacterium]|jgi:phosphatidylserine decarboxylase|nr:phosphatidylserine decarboxylase [Rickettsiales bacterium]
MTKFIPSIHREGYIYIIIAFIFTLICSSIAVNLTWISALATLYIAYFFRDPDRVTPENDNLVISAADGVITAIEKAFPPEELDIEQKELMRISTFLSVFDVHINRSPVSGTIIDTQYRSGKFLNASLDKASTDNERQSSLILTDKKQKIVVIQIAGLIAKRIVCDYAMGDNVTRGKKFGIIKFGSRVDIYLPLDSEINVLKGQRVIGGETTLAKLKASSSAVPKATKAKATTKAKISNE